MELGGHSDGGFSEVLLRDRPTIRTNLEIQTMYRFWKTHPPLNPNTFPNLRIISRNKIRTSSFLKPTHAPKNPNIFRICKTIQIIGRSLKLMEQQLPIRPYPNDLLLHLFNEYTDGWTHDVKIFTLDTWPFLPPEGQLQSQKSPRYMR